jgi:hypothetical protein
LLRENDKVRSLRRGRADGLDQSLGRWCLRDVGCDLGGRHPYVRHSSSVAVLRTEVGAR